MDSVVIDSNKSFDEEIEATSIAAITGGWHSGLLVLVFLILMIIFGNMLVLLAVITDRKLRRLATNKFIASLAISDLLVGIVVMPLSLYATINEIHWDLGDHWCQFHLVTGVFSTTASIVHLTAISLDRYFAIIFPTEYQRHSVSMSTLPYIIMIWVVSFAVSSTLFMEKSVDGDGVCWIGNPQYLVLSSLLSFFIPGVIVVYLYVNIFRKLRSHRLYIFGQGGLLKRQRSKLCGRSSDTTRCLPKVIIEEVMSRRGSRLSQTGSNSGTERSLNGILGHKSERSPSQPDAHSVARIEQRWRSSTICAEALKHNRLRASKERMSLVPDPPSMEVAAVTMAYEPVVDASTTVLGTTRNTDSQCLLAEKLSPVQDENLPESWDAENVNTERDLLKPPVTSMTRNDTTQLSSVTVCAEDVKMADDSGKEPEKTVSTTESRVFLTVPNSADSRTFGCAEPSPAVATTAISLQVPKWDCFAAPSPVPSSTSSRSSYTSASGSDDTYRRISVNSYGSSVTDDGTDSTVEAASARKSSTWSTLRTAILAHNFTSLAVAKGIGTGTEPSGSNSQRKSTISRGKLKKIAIQLTRAIRRKRRESLAIKRETRATRVVAAILSRKGRHLKNYSVEANMLISVAFLICWIPYFCIAVYRGICTGLNIQVNKRLHVTLFMVSSWLGYAHSCFNPIIYTCLNKSFRRTIRQMFCCWRYCKFNN